MAESNYLMTTTTENNHEILSSQTAYCSFSNVRFSATFLNYAMIENRICFNSVLLFGQNELFLFFTVWPKAISFEHLMLFLI